MSDEQLAAAKGAILHVPTVAGSVVVTYNLDGNPTLKLSGDVVADIYLGQITKWNDPRLAAENAGVPLPGADIIPNAYPIATFTYLVVYQDQADRDKGTALVRYLEWCENEGQGYAKELGYAPVPEQLQPKIKATLQSINYQGQSLLNP